MGERGHNTNLAAEYYVLSMLYRVGADAYLTLGNKKSIDIVVEAQGTTLTADVKGLRDPTCFPIDNCTKRDAHHFVVFVCFLRRIDDPQCVPEVYVVPSAELEQTHDELGGKSIVYRNPKGNRTVVELSRLRKLKGRYLDKWGYFTANQPATHWNTA